MKRFSLLLMLLGALALTFTACDQDPCDDPDHDHSHDHDHSDECPDNDPEVITTVKLAFSQPGQATQTFIWRDLDGDGGAAPVIDSVLLNAGQTYNLTIELLDESDSLDIENISTEVLAEGEAHQFFFSSTLGVLLNIAYNDSDAQSRPIGLINTVTTSANTAAGSLTVKLLHEPNKAAAGVSGGDPANAGGETDVEVTFPIRIR